MAHNDALVAELEAKSNKLRSHCFTQFCTFEQGHAGGTMSVVDVVTALYLHHIKFDPKDPDWPERDRVVMSKAHCCEAIYAALVELGVYPEETLGTYYCYGSPFQGHADRWSTAGIDYSGGSLGQGLSFAAGMAYAEKLKMILKPPSAEETFLPRYIKRFDPAYRSYCILGDGELHEGQVWEAAMFANKFKLDNLIAIVDYNKWSLDGPTNDVMPIEPLMDKWKAFGWWVTEIDGHDMGQILDALDLSNRMYGDNRPKCIIAHTVKGYGVSHWETRRMHLGRGEEMMKGVREGREKYGDVR
ncbi:MAG: transketolase [Actinobacteria bacterium]|nr:transketolase [Actinomycetota bacterium]